MMRHYLLFILLLFFNVTVFCQSFGDTPRTIIVIGNDNSGGIDRTMMPFVNATLYPELSTIMVELHYIENANIYILDRCNNIVNETIAFDGNETLSLPAPNERGNYTLVIVNQNYYGEGLFSIE